MDQSGTGFTLKTHYDLEQNIFYLLFTDKAKKAIAEEVEDEVFVRFEPDTQKVVSVEYLNFSDRIKGLFGKEMKYLGTERPERLLLLKDI